MKKIIILLILTAILVIYFKSQKQPVIPVQPEKDVSYQYSLLIQTAYEKANARNDNSYRVFQMKISNIFNFYKQKTDNISNNIAEEVSTYKSCLNIIYYMVSDKLKSENKLEGYIANKIKPQTNQVVAEMNSYIEQALEIYKYDLAKSSVEFANDIAVILAEIKSSPINKNTSVFTPDIEKALNNLKYNASGIGASVVFDVYSVIQSNIAKSIGREVLEITGKMFGKQAAKAGASASLAVADGPLPFGDVLAGIGLMWTAYDIYSSKEEFKKEMQIAIVNMFYEINKDINEKTIENVAQMLKEHQMAQKEIQDNALKVIYKNGGSK